MNGKESMYGELKHNQLLHSLTIPGGPASKDITDDIHTSWKGSIHAGPHSLSYSTCLQKSMSSSGI